MARVRRYLGRIEIWLDKSERAAVLETVETLADGESSGPWLTHRAYDDPTLEREYQHLTGPELAVLHDADLATVRDDLQRGRDRIRLDDDRALAWLRALNRLRLVAGARLGITEDGWEDALGAQDAIRVELAMLNDLGWLQEGILRALEPSL